MYKCNTKWKKVKENNTHSKEQHKQLDFFFHEVHTHIHLVLVQAALLSFVFSFKCLLCKYTICVWMVLFFRGLL